MLTSTSCLHLLQVLQWKPSTCKSSVTIQTKTVFHCHAYVYSLEHTNTAQNYNCHIIHGKDTSKNGSRKKKSSNRSYNLKLYIRVEENTPEIKTYSAWSFATRHCLRYSGCFMLTIALHEHYNNILAWQMKKLRHKESEVLQTVCDDLQGEDR